MYRFVYVSILHLYIYIYYTAVYITSRLSPEVNDLDITFKKVSRRVHYNDFVARVRKPRGMVPISRLLIIIPKYYRERCEKRHILYTD